MSNPDLKFRHEMKYVISAAQMPLLKNRICSIMQQDAHAGVTGAYNIRSLYFDSYDNRCYYENENGTDPREKFRIRIYNHSTERITLECKRKERGKTLKTSCPLTLEQANRLIKGIAPASLDTIPPLLRRLSLKMQTELFRPVVIVEYDRTPMIYQSGNVRITFDTNISTSADIQSFFSDTLAKKPIMPAGRQLLEVKFDEYLPDFIYHSLNLSSLQQTAYSKYYLCRKFAQYK